LDAPFQTGKNTWFSLDLEKIMVFALPDGNGVLETVCVFGGLSYKTATVDNTKV
jgi:hypothetical protein